MGWFSGSMLNFRGVVVGTPACPRNFHSFRMWWHTSQMALDGPRCRALRIMNLITPDWVNASSSNYVSTNGSISPISTPWKRTVKAPEKVGLVIKRPIPGGFTMFQHSFQPPFFRWKFPTSLLSSRNVYIFSSFYRFCWWEAWGPQWVSSRLNWRIQIPDWYQK